MERRCGILTVKNDFKVCGVNRMTSQGSTITTLKNRIKSNEGVEKSSCKNFITTGVRENPRVEINKSKNGDAATLFKEFPTYKNLLFGIPIFKRSPFFPYFMKNLEPVEDVDIEGVTFSDLARQMAQSGGFSAKKFGVGVNILKGLVKEKDCLTFLSLPAAPLATGLRGVIRHLIKNKMVDVIITTCGFLDHDVARTFKAYYQGDFMMDDKALGEEGINRLGSVLVPNESYGLIIEEKLKPVLEELYTEGKRKISTKEFCDALGEFLGEADKAEESVLYWAHKNKIPIFIPAPTDGSVGSQVWSFNQKHKDFIFDILKDQQELSELVFKAKKMGALMIGGGVSKHHVIWWSQFNGGLDYAVYITTAPEYDGSLSGAQTREAISWGKLKEEASHITIEGDATLILPFMIAALEEKKN